MFLSIRFYSAASCLRDKLRCKICTKSRILFYFFYHSFRSPNHPGDKNNGALILRPKTFLPTTFLFFFIFSVWPIHLPPLPPQCTHITYFIYITIWRRNDLNSWIFFNTRESHRVTKYLQNAYKNKNFEKNINNKRKNEIVKNNGRA